MTSNGRQLKQAHIVAPTPIIEKPVTTQSVFTRMILFLAAWSETPAIPIRKSPIRFIDNVRVNGHD
jgi:hypothetical protein